VQQPDARKSDRGKNFAVLKGELPDLVRTRPVKKLLYLLLGSVPVGLAFGRHRQRAVVRRWFVGCEACEWWGNITNALAKMNTVIALRYGILSTPFEVYVARGLTTTRKPIGGAPRVSVFRLAGEA
jgi:hypothetical protein